MLCSSRASVILKIIFVISKVEIRSFFYFYHLFIFHQVMAANSGVKIFRDILRDSPCRMVILIIFSHLYFSYQKYTPVPGLQEFHPAVLEGQ